MSLHPFRSFGSRTAALATAGVLSASALGAFPAAAQQVLNNAQCQTARGVAIATIEKYTGKMSEPLAKSFGNFIKTCDLKTKFDRVPGTVDDDAWGEFRVKIISIRTADASKPVALAK